MKADFDTYNNAVVLVLIPENATETLALLTWGKAFGLEPRYSGQPGFMMRDPMQQNAIALFKQRREAEAEPIERPTGQEQPA